MVRFARVVSLGTPHHVTQRGNARRFILEGDSERSVYLDLLQQGLQRQGVELIGYCWQVWVLPKGKIEPGEDPRKTAVREVSEETGYWARVETWLDDLTFSEGKHPQIVRFYLMQVEKEAEKNKWLPENRQFQWLSLEAAKDLASFRQTKDLLEKVALRKVLVDQPNTASRS